MKVKKIEWEVEEWIKTKRYQSKLPFGYRCVVQKHNGGWRYSFKQRALTVEEGFYRILGDALGRCEDLWEELATQVLEENKGCEFCVWEKEAVKPLLKVGVLDIEGTSCKINISETQDLSVLLTSKNDWQVKNIDIAFCLKCGRRL